MLFKKRSIEGSSYFMKDLSANLDFKVSGRCQFTDLPWAQHSNKNQYHGITTLSSSVCVTTVYDKITEPRYIQNNSGVGKIINVLACRIYFKAVAQYNFVLLLSVNFKSFINFVCTIITLKVQNY